jgi:hypothetical protein
MAKTRQRHVRTLGDRVRIEEWLTEHDGTTLADTQTQWIAGRSRFESDHGPVNRVSGVYSLALDGTVLTPE